MKISNKDEEIAAQRTVVVGAKMDSESREILTWALVKVAKAGDRVVVLHVIPSNSEVYDPNGKSSSLISIVKAFDSVLAVYDGFCNLKQIDLKLKLCRGSSVRKVLVTETKSYEATNLIVGIHKNRRSIGSSRTSIARYCSKKLHKHCSVLAVNNGKIVFQREATENKNSSKTHNGNHHHSFGIKAQQSNSFIASRPSFNCLPAVSKALLTYDSRDRNWSDCSHSDPLPLEEEEEEEEVAEEVVVEEGTDQDCTKPVKSNTLALVPMKRSDSSPGAIRPRIIHELHVGKPGWPLLRKAVLTNKKTNVHEKPKSCVVQWAMRLPNRYTAPSILHSDCQAIVPFKRTDSSCASQTTCDEEKEPPEELRSLQEKYSAVCRVFSYKELNHATSDFSTENLIGRGGSSKVYKGYLSDGMELAVKVLKPSEDVMKEFVSEIEIITTLHHKNVVSLYGFCFDNGNLILVYDFLSRGSLEEVLHGKKENKDVLSWGERYKIALGVAEALDYLHSGGSAPPVIHRDIKSSNILLSNDFDPQVADFGLALWASSSSSQMTCNDVAGTFGYLAPEYFMYGKVNEKIDVYAFGVVLLELLSGRTPVCSRCPKGEESLVMWAKKILQDGKGKQLVDPCLGDKYDDHQLERMILAASICIRQAPRARPRMALVVKLLQGDPYVLQWAKSQVNASEEFDGVDEDTANQNSNIQSHINLAFLDVEDDTLSVSSVDHSIDFITANTSLEEYLKGRWSRSSSFD